MIEGCDRHKRFIPNCEDCFAPQVSEEIVCYYWKPKAGLSALSDPVDAVFLPIDRIPRHYSSYEEPIKMIPEIEAQSKISQLEERLRVTVETLEIISGMKEGFEDDNYRAIKLADESLAAIKGKK